MTEDWMQIKRICTSSMITLIIMHLTQLITILVLVSAAICFRDNFNRDFNELEQLVQDDTDYHTQIVRLHDKTLELEQHFHEHDVRNYTFNGLRSFASVVHKYFRTVLKKQKKKNYARSRKIAKKAKDAAILLNDMTYVIELMRYNYSSPYAVTNELLALKFEHIRSLISMDTFWLSRSMKTPLILYRGLHCLQLHKPTHMQMFNRTHDYDTAADFAYRGNVAQLKSLWSWWEAQVPQNTTELTIDYVATPIQTDYIIDRYGNIDKDSTGSDVTRITSQIVRVGEPNGDLVLHLHGGGFVSLRPAGHSAYLSFVAQQLQNVTFMSVDFRNAPEHKFPAAVQDCLDVYLWLVNASRSDVEATLGFKPRRVILLGDSAGANLALSLMRLADRLNLQLPDGLFFMYPHTTLKVSNLRKISKVLMAIDPILPLSAFFSWPEAYAPGEHVDLLYRDDPQPWYRTYDLERRGNEIESLSRTNELFNPLLGDMSMFKKTPLVVMAPEFDPLLDEAVELVNVWPSEDVQLHVIRGQTHAFPLSVDLSAAVRHELKFCARKLRAMFQNVKV